MMPVTPSEAQVVMLMPPVGQMIHVTRHFEPPQMIGLKVDLKDPFSFNFIMDQGQKPMPDEAKKEEFNKLIKYFLVSLAMPNKDMWVNLSPYESQRIIPRVFAQTEMGRDLLAQDYVLKQLTASLVYPEDELGKKFWARIYQEARERFGTAEVNVNTFNKVWIVADKADIYQKGNTAFLVKSHLKVMLEEDYMAIEKNKDIFGSLKRETDANRDARTTMASKVVREIIIPALEKEVNEGASFATVRQVYGAEILATWFKKTLRESLLGQVFADKSKIEGQRLHDPKAMEKIYRQYLRAYKKGVFNYIKEDMAPDGQIIPRKYFSGGVQSVDGAMLTTITPNKMASNPAMRAEVRHFADQAISGAYRLAAVVVSLATLAGALFVPEMRDNMLAMGGAIGVLALAGLARSEKETFKREAPKASQSRLVAGSRAAPRNGARPKVSLTIQDLEDQLLRESGLLLGLLKKQTRGREAVGKVVEILEKSKSPAYVKDKDYRWFDIITAMQQALPGEEGLSGLILTRKPSMQKAIEEVRAVRLLVQRKQLEAERDELIRSVRMTHVNIDIINLREGAILDRLTQVGLISPSLYVNLGSYADSKVRTHVSIAGGNEQDATNVIDMFQKSLGLSDKNLQKMREISEKLRLYEDELKGYQNSVEGLKQVLVRTSLEQGNKVLSIHREPWEVRIAGKKVEGLIKLATTKVPQEGRRREIENLIKLELAKPGQEQQSLARRAPEKIPEPLILAGLVSGRTVPGQIQANAAMNAARDVGGINLSDEHLVLNIKVDGAGMPLAAAFQDKAMTNLNGLTSIIRKITPITPQNFPELYELVR